MDKYLSVEAVGMSFGASEILSDIDLTIRKAEFVTLIGHSGCGKSTLLNLVAGLIKPTRGAILLAGRHVDGPGPDRGVVFQNHSLLPWLTCYENVHLAVERVFKADLRKKTQAALELVGLSHAEQKYPHQISGGMKQRVGIARALAIEPKVLLSNGPSARIGEVLEVPLPRPRERLRLAHDPRFMDLRAAVLEFLYAKQAKLRAA
jgi:nitrate/nitrite transport system ATP-binding protein